MTRHQPLPLWLIPVALTLLAVLVFLLIWWRLHQSPPLPVEATSTPIVVVVDPTRPVPASPTATVTPQPTENVLTTPTSTPRPTETPTFAPTAIKTPTPAPERTPVQKGEVPHAEL